MRRGRPVREDAILVTQQLALVIGLQNILVVMAGGAAVGRASSAVLRQPWSWRVLAIDACTAAAVTLLILLAAVFIDALWQYAAHAATWPFVLAGIASPAVRHGAAAVLFRRHARGNSGTRP